jgi:hypothetical protein
LGVNSRFGAGCHGDIGTEFRFVYPPFPLFPLSPFAPFNDGLTA